MNVISNTTVISNFAAIGQLEVLHALYGRVFISTDVYAEIQEGVDEGYAFYDKVVNTIAPPNAAGWIHLTGLQTEVELRYLGTLPRRLHKGEASCLAIAKARHWLLLTDDMAARQEARRLKIKLSGSLGSLVIAIEREFCTLDMANTWLLDMLQQGYRSPVTDLTPLVQMK
ncbi:MAG: hypothetical protein ACP5J4_02905 [Anaerolineae bacterium]